MAPFDISSRAGLTYNAWLAQQELPEGFARWQATYSHWDYGSSLGWAIHCYTKSKAWKKLQYIKAKKARRRDAKTDR